jgi:hypothetical protein
VKLSTRPFCIGRPGWMSTNSIFRSIHQARKWRLVSSGPLWRRVTYGTPRSAIIASSTASLSGWQSWCPLPAPSILVCTRPPRQYSDRRSAAHHIVHEVQRPFLVSPPSKPAEAVPHGRSVSASFVEGSIRPPGTFDARACGSPPPPSGAATQPAVDSRSAAFPAPTPPASCAAVHPTAWFDSGNWRPPPSSGCTPAAG